MPVRRRQCGAMEEYERLLEEEPSFRDNQQRAEEFTARSLETGEAQRIARRLIRIPTVVHVVYKRDRENISKSQINSQITALNRDFRATNPDRTGVPDAWKGLVADAKVEFELARRDPRGRPTDGVTRTKTDRDFFGTGDAVKTKSKGGAPASPSSRYLNVWVCNLGGGLLGYAQFPGGPAGTDGVVILHSAFGTRDSAGTVRSRADDDARGRALAQPPSHLGGHVGLQRRRSLPGHAERQGPQLRQADVPANDLRQRPNGDMSMNYMDYVDEWRCTCSPPVR